VVDERIAKRKLSDDVFDRLKAQIISGEIAVGDPLPSERALMERFGVGRPAIREALQALNNLGLIVISHGERARVNDLTAAALLRQIDLPAQVLLSSSARSLKDLMEVRLFFERGMVRAAAERASSADVKRLKRRIMEQRESVNRIKEFVRRDMAFHAEITAIAGNPIFSAVSQAMLGWLENFHIEMLHWSGKETVTISEHEDIVEAIAARDAAVAEAAMTRHLERSNALYVHPLDIQKS